MELAELELWRTGVGYMHFFFAEGTGFGSKMLRLEKHALTGICHKMFEDGIECSNCFEWIVASKVGNVSQQNLTLRTRDVLSLMRCCFESLQSTTKITVDEVHCGKPIMTICNPFLFWRMNLIHNMNSSPLIPKNFVTGGNQIFIIGLCSGSRSGEPSIVDRVGLTSASLLAEKLRTRLSLGNSRETAETKQKKSRVNGVTECINFCSIKLETQLESESI